MVALPQPKPVIAATYERVSTRAQGQHGYSLATQRQTLGEFVAAQGWALPEHLRFRDGEDENASGAREDLPDLNRMLDAARRGEFSVLAVPDFDRFARTLSKGLALQEQLKRYGVRVVFQRVPVDDSPEGRLQQHLLYSIAEYEREKIALRTKSGRRAKAEAGEVTGQGLPPFGYRFVHRELTNGKRRVCGLEPAPLTAPVVRRIFADLRHRSTGEVAATLNAEGVPAPRGGRWLPATVYGVAVERVYMGQWLYGRSHRRVSAEDPSVVPVAVPALVTPTEWERVREALGRRSHGTSRRGRIPRERDPYLLRGLLTCGRCGGGLHANPNYGRYYRCGRRYASSRHPDRPPCDIPDVYAEDLEAELWRVLGATLLDPAHLAEGLAAGVARHQEADRLRQDRIAAIDAELARQRKRLDGYVRDLGNAGEGELRALILRQAQDIERTIGRLAADRTELAAVRAEGLSPDEATAIEAFAAEIRAGLDVAAPAERRRLVELLDIRGTVTPDAEGIKLGRKHRFRIDWAGRVPLRDSAGQVNNWVIHKIGDAGVIATLQRSVGGIDEGLWKRLPGLAPGQAVVSFTHMHRPVLTAIDPTPAKLRMVE